MGKVGGEQKGEEMREDPPTVKGLNRKKIEGAEEEGGERKIGDKIAFGEKEGKGTEEEIRQGSRHAEKDLMAVGVGTVVGGESRSE